MNNSLSKRASDWREGRRLRAWELKGEGFSQQEIANALGVSKGAVSQWMKHAREGGIESLKRRIATDGEDSAIRGLHISLAFFAASIQGWTTLRLSSSQALTPASGSPASLMSVSIWLTSSLLSEMDLRSS